MGLERTLVRTAGIWAVVWGVMIWYGKFINGGLR